MILQKDYKANLTSTLAETNSGEIEVRLSNTPVSNMGFLLFEPGTDREETCLYHRKVGNSVFIYGVNRDNPQVHLKETVVMLTNSIDMFNYLLGKVGESFYIYKKDLQNVIIQGGNFYINNKLITIADVDTSVVLENKVLSPDKTNYVYLKNNDIYINEVYNDSLYPIADIDVDTAGNISNITIHQFKDLYNFFGYAPLDENNKIPFIYLPSIFANIENYATVGDLPLVGDAGILYTVSGSAISYRWDGEFYIEMSGIGDMFGGNNLSEITNQEAARNNLNVYSQIESDERYLNEAENLGDIPDFQAARDNLDIYNKLETERLRKFGGDASDGDLTISTGTTTLTLVDGFLLKNYDNLNISGTAILDITGNTLANGAIAFIRVKGNLTMSGGTIQMNGQGAKGGAATGSVNAGENGSKGINMLEVGTSNFGGGGNYGGGGGYGVGGLGIPLTNSQKTILLYKTYKLQCGAGGGSGSYVTIGVSGAGGAGGGILIIEVGGTVNITGGTIQSNGNNGTGPSGSCGGGGGGAGGSILICYNELTAITGTLRCNGGNGTGNGANNNPMGYGGGGGGSYSDGGQGGIFLGAAGVAGTSNAYGTGGTYTGNVGGGGGGAGYYITLKNTEFF